MMFLKLTGYVLPQPGKTYSTRPVWVNFMIATRMETYEATSERAANGLATPEQRVTVTSICVPAAFQDQECGVSVMETPEQIIAMIEEKMK